MWVYSDLTWVYCNLKRGGGDVLLVVTVLVVGELSRFLKWKCCAFGDPDVEKIACDDS